MADGLSMKETAILRQMLEHQTGVCLLRIILQTCIDGRQWREYFFQSLHEGRSKASHQRCASRPWWVSVSSVLIREDDVCLPKWFELNLKGACMQVQTKSCVVRLDIQVALFDSESIDQMQREANDRLSMGLGIHSLEEALTKNHQETISANKWRMQWLAVSAWTSGQAQSIWVGSSAFTFYPGNLGSCSAWLGRPRDLWESSASPSEALSILPLSFFPPISGIYRETLMTGRLRIRRKRVADKNLQFKFRLSSTHLVRCRRHWHITHCDALDRRGLHEVARSLGASACRSSWRSHHRYPHRHQNISLREVFQAVPQFLDICLQGHKMLVSSRVWQWLSEYHIPFHWVTFSNRQVLSAHIYSIKDFQLFLLFKALPWGFSTLPIWGLSYKLAMPAASTLCPALPPSLPSASQTTCLQVHQHKTAQHKLRLPVQGLRHPLQGDHLRLLLRE